MTAKTGMPQRDADGNFIPGSFEPVELESIAGLKDIFGEISYNAEQTLNSLTLDMQKRIRHDEVGAVGGVAAYQHEHTARREVILNSLIPEWGAEAQIHVSRSQNRDVIISTIALGRHDSPVSGSDLTIWQLPVGMRPSRILFLSGWASNRTPVQIHPDGRIIFSWTHSAPELWCSFQAAE